MFWGAKPRLAFLLLLCASSGIVLVKAKQPKVPRGQDRAEGVAERARKLHFSSIVVDTHDDTTQRFLDGDFDIAKRNTLGSIDIPRMKKGGLGAIFFSIWMPSKITGPEAVKRAIDQFDAVREQVREHSADLELVTTAEGIQQAHANGLRATLACCGRMQLWARGT
jgi:membrane dipeptidase